MSDDRLKSLADRIERLMNDRDDIQSDIRDVYQEAKSAGYVPKVLRKAITRKRMDPSKRDEEDSILDLYEHALSPAMRAVVKMAADGASAREIEAETGVDHATVARSVALNRNYETAEREVDFDEGDAGRPIATSESAAQAVNADPPSGREALLLNGQGSQPRSLDNRTPAEIMGEIPEPFRRAQPGAV